MNKILLYLLLYPLVFFTFNSRLNAGTLRYRPDSFDKLLIEAEIGKIRIEGNGDGQIETTVGPLWKEIDCELYGELDDRVLKIKLDFKDGEKVGRAPTACDARVVVKIPSMKDLEIKAGTTDILIDSMSGKAKVRLKKGGLDIHSDLAELEVRGESVTLTSSGVIAKINVELDQNNLELEIKNRETQEEILRKVALDISALKTEVTFPLRAKVKTRMSGDGIQARFKSECLIPAEGDPLDFELRINSDSGSVGIKKI